MIFFYNFDAVVIEGNHSVYLLTIFTRNHIVGRKKRKRIKKKIYLPAEPILFILEKNRLPAKHELLKGHSLGHNIIEA